MDECKPLSVGPGHDAAWVASMLQESVTSAGGPAAGGKGGELGGDGGWTDAEAAAAVAAGALAAAGGQGLDDDFLRRHFGVENRPSDAALASAVRRCWLTPGSLRVDRAWSQHMQLTYNNRLVTKVHRAPSRFTW